MNLIPRVKSFIPSGEGELPVLKLRPEGAKSLLELLAPDLELLEQSVPPSAPPKQKRPLRLSLGEPDLSVCSPLPGPELREEAYCLVLSAKEIVLTAPSPGALHYGLATLRQIFHGGVLEAAVIRDYPDFRHRGLMLDISRGKLPKISYLKDLVRFLSDLKYNILQLYCEDKHLLPEHPLTGTLTGGLSRQDVKELDDFCRRCFMELQPNIQTYSHMHGLLRLPGYADLSENDGLFSLAAGKEDVYEFLDGQFAAVLPWYSSRTLNINMDEAYDLGSGYSKEAVEKEGKGPVFLRHIQRVITSARRRGAGTIQLWGDAAAKYPDLVKELPEDVIIIDWNYNPADSYPSIGKAAALGRECWAAPGVSSWNSLFPRVYNSYINMSRLAIDALDAGASGYLLTDWGDYGHIQPHGLSLYGYLFGAEQAFNGGKGSIKDFEDSAERLFFSSSSESQGFQALMDSNLAENIKTGFKTMSAYAFFDDLLGGLSLKGNDVYPKVSRKAFTHLKTTGEKALALLEQAKEEEKSLIPGWERILGKTFSHELKLSAKMTAYTGRKGLLSLDILKTFEDKELTPSLLGEFIHDIKILHRDFYLIREFYAELWDERAEKWGKEGALFFFDKASVQLSRAAQWLAEQRELLLAGKKPDRELKTYRAADEYTTLWSGNFKNMWDKAYPWR